MYMDAVPAQTKVAAVEYTRGAGVVPAYYWPKQHHCRAQCICSTSAVTAMPVQCQCMTRVARLWYTCKTSGVPQQYQHTMHAVRIKYKPRTNVAPMHRRCSTKINPTAIPERPSWKVNSGDPRSGLGVVRTQRPEGTNPRHRGEKYAVGHVSFAPFCSRCKGPHVERRAPRGDSDVTDV